MKTAPQRSPKGKRHVNENEENNYLCASIILVSCINNNATNGTEQIDKNSPQFTPEELDSLAICAWGDVKFGMSKKEVQNSAIFDASLCATEEYSSALQFGLKLHCSLSIKAEVSRKTSNLVAVYLKLGDAMWTSSWASQEAKLEEFNYLLLDMNTIVEQFTGTYGEPIYHNTDYKRQITEMYQVIIAIWSIESPNNGTKTIKIELSRNYDYGACARIYIFNSKFMDTPTEEEEEEAKRIEDEKKAKADKALKNAF